MVSSVKATMVTKTTATAISKTRLGKKMFSKLKVYPGSEHPHAAQQPQTLEL